MNCGSERDRQVLRLGRALKSIRDRDPKLKSLPVQVRLDAIALLNAGVHPSELSAVSGLAAKTFVKWKKRYSSEIEVARSRKLVVVPERSNSVIAEVVRPESVCEIDVGSAVVLRVPVSGLTCELLRSLREAFQPC